MKRFIKIALIFSLIYIFNLNYILAEEKVETLMWSVSSLDGANVYILGSIHLADSTIYPINSKIENAFDKSDALVLEILVDEISPFDVMKYLMYNDDRTLESEISPELYAKIAAKFEENNIPKIMYNKLKPWFAVMFLQSSEYKASGLTAEYGVDMYFLGKAREEEKEVLEIESVEFQMKLMDELGEFTGEYLQSMLEASDIEDNSMEELMLAWKNGDDKKIEELSNQGSDKGEFNAVMEKLNYQRNINMVSKIKDYLKDDKTYFVVVGAAHVVGEKGLIQLLKNENEFEIKRY